MRSFPINQNKYNLLMFTKANCYSFAQIPNMDEKQLNEVQQKHALYDITIAFAICSISSMVSVQDKRMSRVF